MESFLSLVCGEDGILLLDANMILRAGGYFVWLPEPVYGDGKVS